MCFYLAEDKSLMIDDDFTKEKNFAYLVFLDAQEIFAKDSEDLDINFILEDGNLYISILGYKSLITDFDGDVVSMQREKGGIEEGSSHDFLVLTSQGDVYKLKCPYDAMESWYNEQTFLKISKNEPIKLGFEKINKDIKVLALTNYCHGKNSVSGGVGTVYGSDRNYYTVDDFEKVEKREVTVGDVNGYLLTVYEDGSVRSTDLDGRSKILSIVDDNETKTLFAKEYYLNSWDSDFETEVGPYQAYIIAQDDKLYYFNENGNMMLYKDELISDIDEKENSIVITFKDNTTYTINYVTKTY